MASILTVLKEYVPGVTPVVCKLIVPVLVIGPPVRPVPVSIAETAEPLEAEVIRPVESTVTLASVYEPGVTPVF